MHHPLLLLLLALLRLSSAGVTLRYQLDGKDIQVTVDNGVDTAQAIRNLANEHALDPAHVDQIRSELVEELRNKGVLPTAVAHINFQRQPEGVIRHDCFLYLYRGQEVEQSVRSSGASCNLSTGHIAAAAWAFEGELDLQGIGLDRRIFPSGTLNRPQPHVDKLRRGFHRVRFFRGVRRDPLIYRPNLEGLLEALDRVADRTGRRIAAEVVDEIDPSDTYSLYVLFSPFTPYTLPRYYIVIQLEQLMGASLPASYFRKLRSAMEVWDYSNTNAVELAKHGVESLRLVPLFYSPFMELQQRPIRTVDVNFFGTLSERRGTILSRLQKELAAAGVSIEICETCYGDERLGAIASLNVHRWYTPTILEAHRIYPLLANRVYVISERGNDTWYDDRFADVVDFVPEWEMGPRAVAVVRWARSDPGEFVAEVERRYRRTVELWDGANVLMETGAFEFLARRTVDVAHPEELGAPLGYAPEWRAGPLNLGRGEPGDTT